MECVSCDIQENRQGVSLPDKNSLYFQPERWSSEIFLLQSITGLPAPTAHQLVFQRSPGIICPSACAPDACSWVQWKQEYWFSPWFVDNTTPFPPPEWLLLNLPDANTIKARLYTFDNVPFRGLSLVAVGEDRISILVHNIIHIEENWRNSGCLQK